MPTKKKILFEDVVRDFDRKFEVTIRQYAIRSTSKEDLKSEIYLKMLETDYLSKFNPTKGSLSTFVYSFVRNHLSAVYVRERKTRAGRGLVNAESLSITEADLINEDGPSNQDLLFMDFLRDNTVQDQIDRQIFLSRLMDELEKPKFSRCLSFGPSGIPRSTKEIVRLLLKGYTVKDIASRDLMDMSIPWVRKNISKLRKVRWLQEYKYGF